MEPFAYLLGADEITLDYVKQYILGIAPFSVCYLVSYNLEVLVKTDGYPRYALFTVIGGCLTNCVLDYIAIFTSTWACSARRSPRASRSS